MSNQTSTTENATSATPLHPKHTFIGAGLLFLAVIWALFGSGDIRIFIEPNTMILVLGILAGGLWMCFGPMAVISAIHNALFGGADLSQSQLTQATAVFGRAYQLAWAAGLSGCLFGLIIMLSNMDDPSAIGPGMAICLLSAMYGLILAEFIFSPMQQVLISRAYTTAPTEPSHTSAQRSMLPLGVTIVALACLSMLILLVSIM